MKILGIAWFLACSSALASTKSYDLKMDLPLNGKHISFPRVKIKEGETATVTLRTDKEVNFIEVVATESLVQDRQGIMMKFAVGTVGKNGARTIVSKPQILANENEPAQITIREQGNGPEQLTLSVIAMRKTF